VQDTSNRRLSFSPHVEFIPECFGTVTFPSPAEESLIVTFLANIRFDSDLLVAKASSKNNTASVESAVAKSNKMGDRRKILGRPYNYAIGSQVDCHLRRNFRLISGLVNNIGAITWHQSPCSQMIKMSGKSGRQCPVVNFWDSTFLFL
jgi:hypothetical protein